MAKKIETYTVRNSKGQFLGAYRADSSASAVAAHNRGQNVYFSTFKGTSQKLDCTAKVEA